MNIYVVSKKNYYDNKDYIQDVIIKRSEIDNNCIGILNIDDIIRKGSDNDEKNDRGDIFIVDLTKLSREKYIKEIETVKNNIIQTDISNEYIAMLIICDSLNVNDVFRVICNSFTCTSIYLNSYDIDNIIKKVCIWSLGARMYSYSFLIRKLYIVLKKIKLKSCKML